ncbi:13999_t:CDS:1, partial [Dentiscutata heterogama]
RNISGEFIAGFPTSRLLFADTGTYFLPIIDFKILHLTVLSKSLALAFSRTIICPSRYAYD